MYLYTVIFICIFAPVIRSPLGSFGDLSLLFVTFFLFWAVLKGYRIKLDLRVFILITATIAALACANAIFVSDGLDWMSLPVVIRPLKGVVVLLGLLFLVDRLCEPHAREVGPKRAFEALLSAVYLAVVAHAVIIVLQFIFPEFRDFTYSVLAESNVLEVNKQFRMPGLAGAGGAQLSAAQGLGFFVGVHLAGLRDRYLPYVLGNLMLFASFVLTGRTGFVLAGISVLYLCINHLLGISSLSDLLRVRRKTVFLIGGGLLVLYAAYCLILTSAENLDDPILKTAVTRTFDTLLQVSETGEFSDATLTALSEMYDFPQKMSVLLFGDVMKYDNWNSGYSSDIGYIRIIWGYGFVGLFLHILFYFMLVLLLLRPRVRDVMGVYNTQFGIWILGSIFILNYKEVFFFSRMTYQISVIIVAGLTCLSFVGDSFETDKYNRCVSDKKVL